MARGSGGSWGTISPKMVAAQPSEPLTQPFEVAEHLSSATPAKSARNFVELEQKEAKIGLKSASKCPQTPEKCLKKLPKQASKTSQTRKKRQRKPRDADGKDVVAQLAAERQLSTRNAYRALKRSDFVTRDESQAAFDAEIAATIEKLKETDQKGRFRFVSAREIADEIGEASIRKVQRALKRVRDEEDAKPCHKRTYSPNEPHKSIPRWDRKY